MKIRETSGFGELCSVRRLYGRAFPASEKKPFWLIRKKCRDGLAEMLVIENGDFAGLAITALYGDYVLLDYFAVHDKKRGSGIGSEAIKLLCDRYGGKKFFLEIESTKIPSDNMKQRESRKRFYLRNGLVETGMEISLFGVRMEVLSNGCGLTYDEYTSLYRETYGDAIVKRIKRITPEGAQGT